MSRYTGEYYFITHCTMSIKIKRQKLIDPTKQNKKRKSPSATKPQNAAQVQPKKEQITTVEKKSSHAKYFLLGFIVLAGLIIPKPNLIKYQKLGVVTESIYWPGFIGIEAKLFDSNLTVSGDIDSGALYFCDQLNTEIGCQKYHIIEQKGLFGALQHLVSD